MSFLIIEDVNALFDSNGSDIGQKTLTEVRVFVAVFGVCC